MLATSAATGAGLDELRAAIFERVPGGGAAAPPAGELPATHRVYRPGEDDASGSSGPARAPSGSRAAASSA